MRIDCIFAESLFAFHYESEIENELEILSKRKGRQNLLRIYAIKIDSNCYVITGGAIKITETMQGHQDTLLELTKLEKCKQYLKENDVFDSDSFYELVNDN
jgi:hypothetical protein